MTFPVSYHAVFVFCFPYHNPFETVLIKLIIVQKKRQTCLKNVLYLLNTYSR